MCTNLSLFIVQQLCLVLFVCLVLWATSAYTSIDSTLVALLGIVTLLYMETIQWKDVAQNTNAVSGPPPPPLSLSFLSNSFCSGKPSFGSLDSLPSPLNFHKRVLLLI